MKKDYYMRTSVPASKKKKNKINIYGSLNPKSAPGWPRSARGQCIGAIKPGVSIALYDSRERVPLERPLRNRVLLA